MSAETHDNQADNPEAGPICPFCHRQASLSAQDRQKMVRALRDWDPRFDSEYDLLDRVLLALNSVASD